MDTSRGGILTSSKLMAMGLKQETMDDLMNY